MLRAASRRSLSRPYSASATEEERSGCEGSKELQARFKSIFPLQIIGKGCPAVFVVSISPIRKIFSGSLRWFDVVNDFHTVLCSTSVSAWPAAVYYIAYTADLADIAEMRKCKNSDYFIVRSKAISYTAFSLI